MVPLPVHGKESVKTAPVSSQQPSEPHLGDEAAGVLAIMAPITDPSTVSHLANGVGGASESASKRIVKESAAAGADSA